MSRLGLLTSIAAHEGDRERLYDDATGKDIVPGYTLVGRPTIGQGLNATVFDAVERAWLRDHRLANAEIDLDRNVPWWRSLDEQRRDVLHELAYAMGWPVLAGFVKMLDALHRHDYQVAALELADSDWARTVGRRAVTLAAKFHDGQLIA